MIIYKYFAICRCKPESTNNAKSTMHEPVSKSRGDIKKVVVKKIVADKCKMVLAIMNEILGNVVI